MTSLREASRRLISRIQRGSSVIGREQDQRAQERQNGFLIVRIIANKPVASFLCLAAVAENHFRKVDAPSIMSVGGLVADAPKVPESGTPSA